MQLLTRSQQAKEQDVLNDSSPLSDAAPNVVMLDAATMDRPRTRRRKINQVEQRDISDLEIARRDVKEKRFALNCQRCRVFFEAIDRNISACVSY